MHKKGRLTFGYYFELKPSFRNVQRWVKSLLMTTLNIRHPWSTDLRGLFQTILTYSSGLFLK